MKKIISLLSVLAMLFVLSMPVMAIKAAKFSLRVVSETKDELTASIDFEGGTAFQCLDFELSYNNKKLKATQAYDGDGLEGYIRELKKTGNAGISSVNKDGNPIKGSMAVTVAFKSTAGKDLFIIKFKKLSADSVKSNDIKLEITNCATENEKIDASVTVMLGGKTEASTAVSKGNNPKSDDSQSKTEAKSNDKTEAVSGGSDSQNTTESKDNTTSENAAKDAEINPESNILQKTDEKNQKSNSTKKAITIAAVVICAVLVVSVACVLLTKRREKQG